MIFNSVDIREHIYYSFVIETRDKPDQDLKEHIRAQIGEAMEALGMAPDSYSVTVSQGYGESLGEPNPAISNAPLFGQMKNYLLFAFRSSRDSSGELAEPLTFAELEEEREELARGIYCPTESRIALVLLQDSSLSLIMSYSGKGVSPGIVI